MVKLPLAVSLSVALLLATPVDHLPAPAGFVNDYAHVVDPESKQELEAFCAKVQQQLGVQFAFVTVDSTDDTPIRDYGLALLRKWGVGNKASNEGVLLLVAVHDHKDDLETGYGVEPYITDGFAGDTLRAMRPDLRGGRYGVALLRAAQTMATEIAQGKNIPFTADIPLPPPVRHESRRSGGGIPGPLIILGIFLLLWLLGRGGRRGGGGGSFLPGFLLGSLLGGGRDYGNWGDRGGFGSGSGGGGWGGWGGGSGGGGGASSDW